MVQDDFTVPDDMVPKARTLPRGALVRYREWYGAKGGKLTNEALGAGIAAREKDDPKLMDAVLDPSTFKEDGGPSIAEQINNVLLRHQLMSFRQADNSRVPQNNSPDRRGALSGWQEMRRRLIGTGGVPMLYCFSTCRDSIRTIPVLQHDPNRAEDLDTDGEDHAADDWRYCCMARPWLRGKPLPEEFKFTDYVTTRNEYGRNEDSFKTI